MKSYSVPLFVGSCLLLGYSALASGGAQRPAQKPPSKKTIDFNRDVRPILAQHCLVCHGADKEALKKTGNMRLDNFKDATADRGGYRAITPGNLEKSSLWSRVSAKEPEMRMPPKDADVKPLSPAELQTIKKWIEEGAEYRGHWAFTAPKMPTLPAVSNPKWVKNDIDRFILARLDEAHLKPEPEADKATLIRRVSLTLTGLPPTTKEIDAFLADKSPNAYEKVVDRLLASPRYGENQARYWLDAVRYADTHGLHIDNERAVYPYRDWVVRAYNDDLPFDKFTTWQLAGDLLPNPTLDQQIATGYVRMNPTTNEGGVIEAEFLAKNTMDRVDTTATVFLGVTMGCAKCHDHKYDPISMREYYGMYAYFDSTADTPLDGNMKLHAPYIKAPSPEQSSHLAGYEKTLRDLEASTNLDEAKAWAAANAPEMPKTGPWEVSGPYPGKDFDTLFDQPQPANPTWRPLKFELEKANESIIGRENASAYIRTKVTVAKAQTVGMRLQSDDGIKVWVNGRLVHSKKVLRSFSTETDSIKADFKVGENDLLIEIVNASGGDGAFVGFGDSNSRRLDRAHELAAKATLGDPERRELVATYLDLGPATGNAPLYRQTEQLYKNLDGEIPMTLIAQELMKPRETHILKRGQYDQPGDLVPRMVPAAFGPPIPKETPNNRLGLAKWLTNPQNPLVSRVFVNRIWQQHFSEGLVRSSEDFGNRGDMPTHPELLDYLAVRFVKDGWSLKKLHRLIVTSATYRQAATTTKEKAQKDPENKLLSHAPRFRLDAEVIRDQALYVSGLLHEHLGGHGDKPYQPAGLWEIIAYPISDTARYTQDHNGALYHRSLYMFWKRTSPPPTMLILDAPMRESCVVKRSKTNTPTQALVTLNETGFFEAARAFAQKVLKAKPDDDSRLNYAFRCATGRLPSAAEKKVLLDLLNDQRANYKAKPAEAIKALSVGESSRDPSLNPAEHAAWMIVCNLIFNLDETLTAH